MASGEPRPRDTGKDDGRLVGWALADLSELQAMLGDAEDNLLPGKSAPPYERTMTDAEREHEAYHAFQDRAAKIQLIRKGLKVPGDSKIPANLAVVQLLQRAETHIIDLTRRLRETLQLGPILSPRALLNSTMVGMNESDALLAACLRWLPNGLHSASGQELFRAAADIRRALHLIRAAAGYTPVTIKVRAACPECERMSLRANVDDPDRNRWFVLCHAKECRSWWMWAVWDQLSAALGCELYDAMEGAA